MSENIEWNGPAIVAAAMVMQDKGCLVTFEAVRAGIVEYLKESGQVLSPPPDGDLIRTATALIEELKAFGYGETSDRALPGSYDAFVEALERVKQ